MLLADNHFTPVIGIDIHFTTMPPFNPFHPYIGLVLDPFDYIPFIGGTVNVNGIKRGVSDTSGVIIPLVHIPLFTPPWLMTPIIGHESMNFFASQNVYADGSRFSPKGHLLMTCNDIGIPLSLQPGKKKFWKIIPTLFAPTSFSLPIPTGKPVNVGGPYVPDWGGMLKMLVTGFGFGALMKYGRRAVNKLVKSAVGPNSLSRALCRAGFEPVNLINGAVIYDGTDFTLPGPIPFEWKRSWYSDSKFEGLLGHGCHWQYDRDLAWYEEDEALGLRLADGRVVAFPELGVGEEYYLRQEKITLTRFEDHYCAHHHAEHLYYDFTPVGNRHKLTKIYNDTKAQISFDYHGKKLNSITDSAGRTILIESDAQGRIINAIVKTRDTSISKVQYHYNHHGDMISITDALEQSTTIEYAGHLMMNKTDRNGQTFYWEYDDDERCVHTWGEGGWQEGWLQYFPAEGYNLITDANGAATTYYYTPNQLVTQQTNPLGASKFFEYTPFMELYREVDEDGNITGYTYNDRGFITGIEYGDGSAQIYEYDELNRLQIAVTPGGSQTVYTYHNETALLRTIIDADRSVTVFDYNEYGLPTIVSRNGNKVLLGYDEYQNLDKVTGPGGATTRWVYNSLGDVVSTFAADGGAQSFEYDRLGRVVTIHSAGGNTTKLYYDAYDDVLKARDNEHTVQFDYTPLGSLAQRSQAGTRVAFSYDKMEQLLSITNEHREVYSFARDGNGDVMSETGFDGLTRYYNRSAAGRVLKVLRPGGRFTEYEYNATGQVTRADYNDGSWEIFDYDKNGQLTGAENQHSKVYFTRDAMGRVVQETQSIGLRAADGHTITSTYDEEGRRTSLQSSLGANIQTAYSESGFVTQIKAIQQGDDANWQADIQRDVTGRALEYLYNNGVSSSFGYDRDGRPAQHIIKTGGGREAYTRQYRWNATGQLQTVLNSVTGGQISYSYDALSNLASAIYEDGSRDYKTPDAVGNIYRNPNRSDRHYAAGGQLQRNEKWHYYYDSEGNLALKTPFALHGSKPQLNWLPGCWKYSWQGNGMLQSVKRPDGRLVAFEYDALGRRTAKIVHTAATTPDSKSTSAVNSDDENDAGAEIFRYIWDGNVLLHQWSYSREERPEIIADDLGELSLDKPEPVGGVITWAYEESSFTPTARISGDEKITVISDYIGKPAQAYNDRGEKVWEAEYDIYGSIRKHTGDKSLIPFRQAGQYEDEQTGLYYNRFRYYDAENGVYISKDPLSIEGGLNVCAYVGDSNSLVDPFGLSECSGIKGKKIKGTAYRYEESDRISDTWAPHKWNVGATHRYTKPGKGGVYAGTSAETAFAEISHYPVDMNKRVLVSKDFDLDNVLDLTDVSVRKQLNISLEDILGDSYNITHKIGDSAIANGFDGILAPSARNVGGANIMSFKGF